MEKEIKNLIKKYTNLTIWENNKNNSKKLSKEYLTLNFEDKRKLGYNLPVYPNHKYGKIILLCVRDYLISKN